MPKFTKRFFEEAAVTAASAFLSDLVASGFDFTHAGIAAAVGAAARALYGIVIKPVGDTEVPSATK